MTRTPVIIEDAREAYGNTVKFWFHENTNRVSIDVGSASEGRRQIMVEASELVRLDFIPGLTVKYTKPVVIPKYLGAVVERTNGTGKGMNRWVRVFHDDDSSLPWTNSGTGNSCSNDEVAAVLANGGYEREPEFPIRTP